MVLWSLISVFFTGLIILLIGILLLALYIGVFVLLPGYVIYACAKLVMWLIERAKGKVERNDKVKSKLNLSFLEQKYKQMINEEISIEAFNKYLKNEIHIHYNDNYDYCKKIFEAKMDTVNSTQSSKKGLNVWHILVAVLAAILAMNWLGLYLTMLCIAIGVFVFYLIYAVSLRNKENNSGIRYSLYKHIVKFCSEKTMKNVTAEEEIVQMSIDDIMPEDTNTVQNANANNTSVQEVADTTKQEIKDKATQTDNSKIEEKEL